MFIDDPIKYVVRNTTILAPFEKIRSVVCTSLISAFVKIVVARCRIIEAFTIDWNVNTINTVDDSYKNTIGQRSRLGFVDAKIVNRLYCNSLFAVLEYRNLHRIGTKGLLLRKGSIRQYTIIAIHSFG